MKTLQTHRRIEEKLDQIITLRLTQEERCVYEINAEAAGITLGALIRKKLRGLKIEDKSYKRAMNELILIRQELNKIGGLIKHVYNTHHDLSKETAQALYEQSQALKSVTQKINQLRLQDDHKDVRKTN